MMAFGERSKIYEYEILQSKSSYFRIKRNRSGFTEICLQVFRCYVTHALSMQHYNDAFDLVHAFPRLLRKELPRERARARASCFIRCENEAGTDGGQRRERIESGRLQVGFNCS